MQRRMPAARAGLSRLEASIAPPLSGARADHGMDFVDEEDGAFDAFQFLHHRLQPFLEIAAIARARDQRAHVERIDGGSRAALPALHC